MSEYQALISVPILAENDEEAERKANAVALRIRNKGVIVGHVELLTRGKKLVHRAADFHLVTPIEHSARPRYDNRKTRHFHELRES